MPGQDLTTCSGLDDFIAQTGGQDVEQFLSDLGLKPDASGNIPAVANILGDYGSVPLVGGILQWIVDWIMKVFTIVPKAWVKTFHAIIDPSHCASGSLIQLSVYKAAIKTMAFLTRMDVSPVMQRICNSERYICPSRVPGIAEANVARRTGEISKDQWRCWVRMNDIDDKYAENIYQAARVQLRPEQIISLWRRKLIADDQMDQMLYQAGMISIDDQFHLREATLFIPPVTDLLHFIVRGIGDPDLVQRFGLLDEFDQLYQGKLVEWGEANGVEREVMEAYHAGHWQGIGSGQLMTMYQRLRADNVPAGGVQGDWMVTNEDVDRAMRENAIPPFWRERLKEIGYQPAPLRQVVQAFTRAAASKDEVKAVLLDNGYKSTTADQMIHWLYEARRDHLRSHKTVALFIGSGVNRQTATDRLTAEGYEDWEVSNVLDWATDEADDKSHEACLNGIKKNFDCGSCDTTGLQDQLIALDLDPEQVTRLTVQWDCQRKTTPKQVGASQLCSWADNGLIGPQEHYQRLRNLNYDDETATRIVAECNIKLSERQLAARERSLKQAVRDQQSRTNKQDKTQRQALAEARREANQASRFLREQQSALARADREKIRQITLSERKVAQGKRIAASTGARARAIESRLGKAAVSWAETRGIDPTQAAAEVAAAVVAATAAGGGSEDRGIQATILSVLAAKKLGTVDLSLAAADLALALLGYASIADVAACEADSVTCPSVESNGGNVAQATTTVDTCPPGQRSRGDGTCGTGEISPGNLP